MKDPARSRDLLIAVNATPSLSRAAVCRLGQELDRWTGRAARPDAERLAAELSIPRRQMEKALDAAAQPGDLARREAARAERHGARLLTALDAGYPDALRHLALPPPVLYLRGELPAGPAVAIVGSRRADPYGREVAELFARSLAASGLAVVSGFARGVDAAAHRGALSAAGGRTVAVLGCGLGVDYPQAHAALREEIAAAGAVLTEFPCGLAPRSWHFPVRNRIIAALAGGTLVVQAAPRSGSLITARHALDLGREVYAVPGRIFDERSLGPNALIRDGALLVQHPRDILESLLPGSRQLPPPAGPAERLVAVDERELPPGLGGAVVAALPAGALRTPESLALATGASVDLVLGTLLELELNRWVKRHPGPVYSRISA
ncbi:MAG TPA: DNA-processing protein DprA [Thermoanaerobaculia bacterium]|nr:DNA-processing protein DprA [Thermoanaerobaculia bacterium]